MKGGKMNTYVAYNQKKNQTLPSDLVEHLFFQVMFQQGQSKKNLQ